MENFARWGDTINNAFFFVVDIIISLQTFFLREALVIGRVVFLIAILSAALNYGLTGSGLKENIIKITKATIFFFIVIFAYPSIIGFITSWTFSMARGSVYAPIHAYFNQVIDTIERRHTIVASGNTGDGFFQHELSRTEVIGYITRDKNNLLGGLETTRTANRMAYTVVAPASILKIIFFMAKECFDQATKAQGNILTGSLNLGMIIIALICGFIIIFTGAFALLEYVSCFLEFMLVASVGIILFPLSLWEGSKFAAEGFIKALLGFFMKLLFCNLAIFLLIYGFVSLFYIISDTGFTGTVDQVIFIIFTCLLFLYICKSAPGIAQSLLTGAPTLSATGAISTAAGAVSAAAGAAGIVKSAGGMAGKAVSGMAGGLAKAAVGGIGSFAEANAAGKTAAALSAQTGGSSSDQAAARRGAFGDSLRKDIGDSFKAGALGLTRSLLSGGKDGSGGSSGANPHSWRDRFASARNANGEHQTLSEHLKERKDEGKQRGSEHFWKKAEDKYLF